MQEDTCIKLIEYADDMLDTQDKGVINLLVAGAFARFNEWLQNGNMDIWHNLDKIYNARSLERSKHYAKLLKKSLEEVRTSKVNDLNLNRWKQYDDIHTDSLWIIPKRDSSGVHSANYHGNFIPQIPNQMIRRYTKPGDVVIDMFAGSSTAGIEAKRLGRHYLGCELNTDVALAAADLLMKEPNPHKVEAYIAIDDAKDIDYSIPLEHWLIKDKAQLVISHPPYHNIVRFSEHASDLSNCSSIEQFIELYSKCVEQVTPYLETGRFFILVISDIYTKGEWIPLAHLTMSAMLDQGYKLKSTIVKNFDATAGKRGQAELWRYRALVGGFYVFKHEYIFILQKK